MPYPFEKSPLNEHLVNLRNLKKKQYLHYSIFQVEKKGTEISKYHYSAFSEISKAIDETKKNSKISPRTEKKFQNKAQLAVTDYTIENPEPPNPGKCNHSNQEIRKKTHSNNSVHLVKQCLSCGARLKAVKKSDIKDWEKLSYFDENPSKLRKNWTKIKYQIYSGSLVEGSAPTNFDYYECKKFFSKKNPPPKSMNCEHKSTRKTYRTYSSSGDGAVVLQCKTCGKHVSSISKLNIEIKKLMKFDQTLEREEKDKVNVWYNLLNAYCYEKKLEHDAAEKKKLDNGHYSFKAYNTFNTYYESKEWKWARKKIFERDQYECQACGNSAECVHHLTYERIGQESSYDLISLCNQCHERVHDLQNLYIYSYRLTPIEIKNLNETSTEIINRKAYQI